MTIDNQPTNRVDRVCTRRTGFRMSPCLDPGRLTGQPKEGGFVPIGDRWQKKKPRGGVLIGIGLRRQESNLRPPGYEPGELTAAPRRTENIHEWAAGGKD